MNRNRVETPNKDRYFSVTAKRNRQNTASDRSRQISSASSLACSLILARHSYGEHHVLVNTKTTSLKETILVVQDCSFSALPLNAPPHNSAPPKWFKKSPVYSNLNHVRPNLLGRHSGKHVRLFPGAKGTEFVFIYYDIHLHRVYIVNKCFQLEDITGMDQPVFSSDLNPIEHVWVMQG
ncbi:transposable element Tcb1 transposase [Trichonephila clavipes]|nr:transposable element Tcb1 transposase [Trichonephila clavipes]